jgi:hypothetical protein
MGGGGREKRTRAEDARDKRGHGKDGTTDVHRRWRRRRRGDPIVDVAGERRRNNLTDVVGPRTRQAEARQAQDRGRQQEEVPVEEGRPNRGRRGGEAAQ